MVNYDNLSGAEQIPEVAGTWQRRGAALRGRCLGLPPESRLPRPQAAIDQPQIPRTVQLSSAPLHR